LGIILAVFAGGAAFGFVVGFLIRSSISRARRRRWKKMVEAGSISAPTGMRVRPVR
jgi:NhaP-type Na+/H+ or K+/H+ antiporter